MSARSVLCAMVVVGSGVDQRVLAKVERERVAPAGLREREPLVSGGAPDEVLTNLVIGIGGHARHYTGRHAETHAGRYSRRKS